MNTQASDSLPLPLEMPRPDSRTFLNGSVWFVDSDGYRVVFRWHEPLYRVALTDEVHLRLVAVSLRQSGLATQEEICHAFGHSVATQTRWEQQYRTHGIDGLVSKKPGGSHRELDKSQEAFVRRWFHAGCSNREMAKRLSVDEATIRRTLKRLGLARVPVAIPRMLPQIDQQAESENQAAKIVETSAPAASECQVMEVADGEISAPPGVVETAATPTVTCPLPGTAPAVKITTLEEEAASAAAFTLDRNPHDRSGDRALARLGLLADAAPLFADAECLPRAGVLLALPLLVPHGLIAASAQVYHSIGPAFYGLRTIVVTLFLAALLRIKRPEHFKEYRPEDLGAILGLDRAPEVKTVRRKFTRLAAMGRARELMDELARRRIAEDQDRVAFLYLDGHVREYHGKFPLFEAKKAQRQVVTPAATDTWVHDAFGEPLLVVTSEMNAKLTQVLEPILADVRRLVGDQRRMTVIFDRGGFSPKLFQRLIESGFDVITYRKGRVSKLAAGRFAVKRQKIDGVWREYHICDRPRVRVGALPAGGKRKKRGKSPRPYLWMREVRVLRDDGRQTPVLTNRRDLSAVMVAYRIFHRWRQENYFKYAEEEFALDALVEYGAEELPEATDRRNPQWLQLTRRLKEARAKVARLQGELGKEAATNREATRPTMRGFKIAHAELRQQLQKTQTQIERLLAQRQKTPKRIPASDRKMLKTEKKLIADAIKMAAYQVETQLLGMLQDHYARTDEEGRTLLHAAFQSPARLEVTDGELRVTIGRQSSPHRTAALAALCEQLDALAVAFPGTHLRLRLAVQAAEPVIS
jgi:transposase